MLTILISYVTFWQIGSGDIQDLYDVDDSDCGSGDIDHSAPTLTLST